MGSVGVNGSVTFRNFNKGCLLFMSIDGDVASYNYGYCLFPIVGAAVCAVLALVMIIFGSIIVHRNDEYAPRIVSYTVFVMCILLALLSFAICGEIGIGLNKGCKILGPDSGNCRSRKNFNALYGSEISAGLMGAFFVFAAVLELFQLRSLSRQMTSLPSANTSFDNLGQRAVTPQRASTGPLTPQPNNATVAQTVNPVQYQKQEYQEPTPTMAQRQPEMSSAYAASAATPTIQQQIYQQQAYQPQPQPAYQRAYQQQQQDYQEDYQPQQDIPQKSLYPSESQPQVQPQLQPSYQQAQSSFQQSSEQYDTAQQDQSPSQHQFYQAQQERQGQTLFYSSPRSQSQQSYPQPSSQSYPQPYPQSYQTPSTPQTRSSTLHEVDTTQGSTF
ncbi:hypothetical protein BGW38_003380 [Lunasporangiospora selenospora]|uniref:Uncharacterized protein n=1 Tax=Lunasporangiospora selenospora TaxID=979761 RepID=A0A9P6G2P0_9FUNG|nr:hypothetical protein BGW38_003380 [Lunasporangiospora selenospora]